MALRILNYVTNFYMDYINSYKNVKLLPTVFPIMLYNGDNHWNAPTKFNDIVVDSDLLGQFSINFQYFKIAENEFTKENLLKFRNIVSTLFLAESYYDIELLKKEFLELFSTQEDKQAISLFLNWFKQLSEHYRIDKKDYNVLEHVHTTAEEVNAMLIKSLEKERAQLINKGMEKGIEKGIVQGIEKGKIEDAKIMLQKGMPVSFISEITGFSSKKILKLKTGN